MAPTVNYDLVLSSEAREFYRGLLGWAGIGQQVTSSDSEVKARLHTGEGGMYLWVVNPTRTARTATIQPRISKGTYDTRQMAGFTVFSCHMMSPL